jgi:hypothetical protein
MRGPEITFRCEACGGEARCGIDGRGECPCGARPVLALSAGLAGERVVDRCPACDGVQLYVQRDFNQRAGLAVVVVGAVLAPFTHYLSLVVAAIVDAGLYLLLPEIAVCYRCHAHFRGFRRNPAHEAFDLHMAEQYDKAPREATPQVKSR